MINKGNIGDAFEAKARKNALEVCRALMHGKWEVICRGPDGKEKWRDTIENDWVNVGLNELLDKFFKGSAYTAAHYIGITGTTPSPASGDTMASHGGWTEVTAYDEGVRQDFTPGSVSGQSVDNSLSKATFTIDTNSTTVGGAFLCTDDTKGGSGGVLISVGAFTAGDKSLDDNDTLDVQVTYSAADDGA